jgi:hypothetical protein
VSIKKDDKMENHQKNFYLYKFGHTHISVKLKVQPQKQFQRNTERDFAQDRGKKKRE